MTPSTSTETADEIGRLCVGGDWACAHGDLGGLRDIARRLSAFLPEPLHCELDALASACDADAERAVDLWNALKPRLYRDPTLALTRAVTRGEGLAARSRWVPLYRLGAICAGAIVALMFVQLATWSMAPPPSYEPGHAAAVGWLELLATHPLLGLVELDALMLVDYVLVTLLFVALWVALRRTRPVSALLAVVLTAIAAATYFASNPAFTLLALSDRYVDAAGGIARSELIGAAQAALAVYHGTPFDVAYILSAVAGVLACSAMVGSGAFGAPTAVIGLIAYAASLVPPTAGALGATCSLVALLPLAVWLALVAAQLWRLRR